MTSNVKYVFCVSDSKMRKKIFRKCNFEQSILFKNGNIYNLITLMDYLTYCLHYFIENIIYKNIQYSISAKFQISVKFKQSEIS